MLIGLFCFITLLYFRYFFELYSYFSLLKGVVVGERRREWGFILFNQLVTNIFLLFWCSCFLISRHLTLYNLLIFFLKNNVFFFTHIIFFCLVVLEPIFSDLYYSHSKLDFYFRGLAQYFIIPLCRFGCL